jgi:hypothetical protein
MRPQAEQIRAMINAGEKPANVARKPGVALSSVYLALHAQMTS